jgi:hypothetical protein
MDALGDEFKMPSFEIFCDRLTREQSKLMQLDSLSNSKNQALLAHTSKGKKKGSYKKKKDLHKVVRLPPNLNKNQNHLHLPSLVSLPPRQRRKSQMKLAAFVVVKGIHNQNVGRNLRH